MVLLLGTVLALSGSLGGASAAPPDELRPVVLDKGHIDLFELTYDSEAGALDLGIKDDTHLYDLGTEFREPDQVSVLVDSGLTAIEVPDSSDYAFLGAPGDIIYYLPVVQAEDLPWPGWSTERFADTLPSGVSVPDVDGSIELEVEVEGPGDVFTFDSGVAGPPLARYVDTTTVEPDVIPTRPGIHNHNDWAFTELGDYELVVTPTATTSTGATLTGPARSYHFHVGARPEDLPRKVEAGEFGASIAGVPDSVTTDTEVNLEVQLAEPRPEVAAYTWYLNDEVVDQVAGATLTARVDPFDYVVVALQDADGRVLTEPYASFLPPPSAPYAPPNVTATLREGSADDVRVSWGSGFDGRSPITAYDVALLSAAGQTLALRQADTSVTAVTFEDVPRGIWRATVTATNELGVGAPSEASAPLTIGRPSDTAVTAPAVTQVYGAPAVLPVEVSSGATGPIEALVGAQVVRATVTNGRATLSLPAKVFAPGQHSLPISYAGVPGVFNPSTATASLTTLHAAPTVSVKPSAAVRRGGVVKLKVSVRATGVTPTGKVRVTVAGRTTVVRLDSRGAATAKIALPGSTKAGRKRARVTYVGDAFVAAASGRATVKVIRSRR